MVWLRETIRRPALFAWLDLSLDIRPFFDRVEHGIMEQWGIMEHYKQTAPNPLIKTSKQLQR